MKPGVTLLVLWLSASGPASGRGASVCMSSPIQGRDGENGGHESMRPGGRREASRSFAAGRDRDVVSDVSSLGRPTGGHEPGRDPNGLDGVALGPASGHPSAPTSAMMTSAFRTMPEGPSFRGVGQLDLPVEGGRRAREVPPIRSDKVLEPRSLILLAESVICLLVCLPKRGGKAPNRRERHWE
jgi:hypothetical protein